MRKKISKQKNMGENVEQENGRKLQWSLLVLLSVSGGLDVDFVSFLYFSIF